MTLTEEVQHAGRQIANAPVADLANTLNSALELFLSPSFKAKSGSVADTNGIKSEVFASVVITTPPESSSPMSADIPADLVAVVIDATGDMDLASFRSAYARIASSKRLKKIRSPRKRTNPSPL